MTRRGITILEVTVAGGLLAAMMAMCLQMLQATSAQHRAAEIRQTAIREAGNVVERLRGTPWDDLTDQNAEKMQLSEDARHGLPGGELNIELAQSPDVPDAKRITVRVRWQNRAGQFVRPVQLVVWRYRTARGDPS